MRSKSNRRNLWVVVLLIGLFLWWAYRTNQLPSIVLTLPPPVGTATISPPIRGVPTTRSAPGDNRNLLLGNPSGAVHDPSQPTNYLIERPQYVLSYNRDHGIPNWVSWQLTQRDLGDTKRSNTFVSDTTLPA